jgi:hypothetical protein
MVLYLLFGSAPQRFALPALGRGRRSRPTRKRLRRRKLLEIAAESPASGARFVGQCVSGIIIAKNIASQAWIRFVQMQNEKYKLV